jgi:uncharacterized protein YjdB
MKKMFFLMLALLIWSAASMNAQVNIGSTDGPKPGAVLDLSQGAKKLGLILPNVTLVNATTWQLDEGATPTSTSYPAAAGTVVYHDNALSNPDLPAGIYVWNGAKWQAGSVGSGTETSIDVTGVEVSVPSNPMAVNATQTLTATPTPSTAINQTPITWASSDVTVASVSEAGLVTALKGGTTTITAQAPNGVTSLGVAINVKPAQPGAITYNKTTLNTGETVTLSLAAGSQPASATSYKWTYPAAYFSGSSTGTSIELTATNPGTPAATAFGVVATNAYGDSPIRNGQAVTITTPIQVTGVEVSAPSNPMAVNATQTLTATPTPESAVNQTPITWASSDETVASVSEAGLVTALKGGTTTITAQAPNGVTSSGVAINVKPAQPGAITYDKTTLNTGETLTLTLEAAAQPASATSYKWTYPAAYFSGSSTSTSITLTATNPGSPAATAFGVVATNAYGDSPIRNGSAVTIKRLVTSITLPATQEYTSTGTKTKLTATIAPTDASNKTVGSWTSSNTAVATVNASTGAINVIANGTTNITCKSTDGTNITSSSCAVSVAIIVLPTKVVVLPRYIHFTATDQTEQLTASFVPENAVGTVTWSSSDVSTATVDQAGNVTILKPGGARITASSNGKSKITWVDLNNCPNSEYIMQDGTCYVYSAVTGVAASKPLTCPSGYTPMEGLDPTKLIPTMQSSSNYGTWWVHQDNDPQNIAMVMLWGRATPVEDSYDMGPAPKSDGGYSGPIVCVP